MPRSLGSVWQRFGRCQRDLTKKGVCYWLMKGYPGVLSEPDMNQDKVREMFKRAVEQAPVLGRVTNLNKGKNKKSSKKRKRDTAKDVEQDDGNNGDQAPMQDEPDVQVQNLDDQTQDGEVREIPYQQMTTTLNYLFKRENCSCYTLERNTKDLLLQTWIAVICAIFGIVTPTKSPCLPACMPLFIFQFQAPQPRSPSGI